MRAAFLICAGFLAAGCFAVEPPDGAYRCATVGRACPTGYFCVEDVCVRSGAEPDLSVEPADMGPDLAQSPDIAKTDGPDMAKPDMAIGRELCVVAQTGSEIAVHLTTSDGNAAPKRVISGVSTLLSSPTAIAADLANHEIFVANPGTKRVIVFSATASGDVAPARYLDNLGTPMSVAVNPVDNELYVVSRANKRLEVYSRTASGTLLVPKRSIDLTLVSPTGLAYDHGNHELIITDVAAPYAVAVYDSLATGSAGAKRTITGALTQLSIPNAVAVDPNNGEIYIANNNSSAVTVYARTATGNVAPARIVSGLATGLNHPSGIALDATAGHLVVANNASGNLGSVALFALRASGNVAPLHLITGQSARLAGPFGVAYCSN